MSVGAHDAYLSDEYLPNVLYCMLLGFILGAL